jgi:hypothetical protein
MQNEKTELGGAQAGTLDGKRSCNRLWIVYFFCALYMMLDIFHHDWEGVLGGAVICAVFFLADYFWSRRK